MSSSLKVNCSPQSGKKTFEYFFKITFFPMLTKIMDNLCESYATVKNWTRTSHKNVNVKQTLTTIMICQAHAVEQLKSFLMFVQLTDEERLSIRLRRYSLWEIFPLIVRPLA